MDYEKDYSKVAQIKDLPQSYDNAVWIQLERCFFYGSQDTTNTGLIMVQDENGNSREIVRYNYCSAFIHAVELLYYLVKLKHDKLKDLKFQSGIKKANDEAYNTAKGHFKTILTFINKSGLFGYKSLVEYYGGGDEDSEAEKVRRFRTVEEPEKSELHDKENS